ncbi:MAG: ATP synthase F1 subunit epsilon [Opitutae bacterium]|nr:ATP synthase F1 subunit epsilon [Opitutae bacterium]
MPLTLEIVTPEARVYSDTVETVVVPTVQGELGILPGHIPLLTQVEHGELRVTKGGQTSLLAVGGGFMQVEGDLVSVLAEHAIREEQIDESAAEKAVERAQEALKNRGQLDATEVERLEGLVRFSVAQLGVKRRRR